MKWWLILVIIFLAFVQTTIWSFNFLWLFMLALVLLGHEKEALIFGFLGGILLDLLSLGTLGVSSLIILTGVFLVILYQRKFTGKNLIFWLIFFFLGNTIFKFVRGQTWQIKEIILSAILVLITFFLLSKFNLVTQAEDNEGIKLKI